MTSAELFRDDWKSFLAMFADNRGLASLLALINVMGAGFGFFYYSGQFADTPVHLWPFVPDSPIAVLLFAVFVLLHSYRGYQHPGLNALAFAALVKTGVWSTFVILFFWPEFFVIKASFSATLLILHMGMVLEALVICAVWRDELRWEHAILVAGWFLLGDFMDYMVGTVPYPVPFIAGSTLTTVGVASLLSWSIPLALAYMLFRERL